jgi:hypothetical protein
MPTSTVAELGRCDRPLRLGHHLHNSRHADHGHFRAGTSGEQATAPPSACVGWRGAVALGVPPVHAPVALAVGRYQRGSATTPLPYDHFVPRPLAQTTRAIATNAPAEEVWRWLVQLGQDRGGLYSYDWLENLADLDVHSSEEIVPELQDLKVGDLVRLAPERMGAEAGWRVAVMDPGRTLILHQPADPDTGRPLDRDNPDLGGYYGWNWAFVLEESDGGSTRLIVRSRVDGKPRFLIKTFYALLLEFPHFVMERGMLKGITERAERRRMSG